MFVPTEKIFTVYEKPEAAEPTARMELVREGFSVWAFVFTVFWLLSKRLWLASFVYLVLAAFLQMTVTNLGLKPETNLLLQFGLQLALGFLAHDLEALKLTRRGYRFGGVLVANSEMAAEQRYFEHAA